MQNSISLWLVGASMGYAANELHGMAVGIMITAGLTLILGMVVRRA